jgi:glycosyl hydrolase family 64 (putative beta-1,3-glucanase)/ricin-type beta-trefoil lectin protein
MRVRRKLLGVIATFATVVTGGITAAGLPAQAAGPAVLPMRITNQSGRGDAVYLYVIGTNLSTGRLGYVNAGGTFNNWPAGSNPPSPAPDVSIGGPGNGGSTNISIPKNISGRIYFSLGRKLSFLLTPDGLVQPAPWAGGDANRDTLFDWSEFTYNDAGLWLNSSQVDMFAIAHTVTVTDSAGTRSTGSLVANGRDNVINGIKAAGWGGTVYTRSDGTVLRVLAPGKAADTGGLSATYLDPYITSAWNAYTNKTLTVVPFGDQPNLKYFGRTSGNTMNFTNSAGAQVASFNKPSSANVWGCDGALGAPNDQVIGPIARTLCAALNRGTLGTVDTQPSTDASQFYRSNPTNQYAKLVHQNMADGKAYAFAFDDVGNFESLVNAGSPTSAGITLNPFSGGGGTTTPPPPATGSRVISNMNNKCLDVPNGNYADGVRVAMWDCNGGANQNWEFTGGTLRSQNNKCLDVTGNGTANGSTIELWTCNGGANQQFVLAGAADLVNPQANRCVDITGLDGANGATLTLWDCNGGNNQKWHRG